MRAFLHNNTENIYCTPHLPVTGKYKLLVCLPIHYHPFQRLHFVCALLRPFPQHRRSSQHTVTGHSTYSIISPLPAPSEWSSINRAIMTWKRRATTDHQSSGSLTILRYHVFVKYIRSSHNLLQSSVTKVLLGHMSHGWIGVDASYLRRASKPCCFVHKWEVVNPATKTWNHSTPSSKHRGQCVSCDWWSSKVSTVIVSHRLFAIWQDNHHT